MARRGRRLPRPQRAPGNGSALAPTPGPDAPEEQPKLDTSDIAGAPPPEEKQDEEGARRPRAPKPELEDVERWCKRDREFWTKRDQRMQRHHKLWRLDKATPERFRDQHVIIVTTNDPKVFIEKASSMLVSRDHRVEVPPKGEENVPVAERIENACRWFRSFQRRVHREGINNYLDWDQAQCLFLRGWLSDRMMLDPDSRTYVDEHLFDPMSVYPRFGARGPLRVCHVYQTTVEELRDDFGELPDTLEGREDDAKVDVKAVYVNAEPYWHCVVADGQWIKEPTALGHFPWIFGIAKGAFSHHGNDFESAQDAAEHIGQGFLDTIEDAYHDLNDLLTIGMNLLAKQENPPMTTMDASGKPLEVDTGIGGRTPFAPGQSAEVVQVGAKLQNVEAMLSAFQDRENKGAFPGVAWGEGAGLQSGYQGALLLQAISEALVAFVRCFEGFQGARYEKWLTLVRDHALDKGVEIVAKVGATIDGKPAPKALRGRRAWGTVLTPQDLEKNGTDVEVVMEDISPQDKMALANQAVQLVAAGILDLTTAREKYVGLDNADVINERVLSDLLYKNPAAVALLSELALRRTGRWNELTALRAADAQKAAMAGQAGGPNGAAPNGSPVHEAMNFKDLPPALQAQMAEQAGMQMPQGAPPPEALPPGPGGAPPPNGAGPGQPPPGVSPQQMEQAHAVFASLPPEVQAVIARLPVQEALALLGLPPDQMLEAMRRLGGGGGQSGGPQGAPPPGPSNTTVPTQMRTGPASAQQLQAQRMASVGLVQARR